MNNSWNSLSQHRQELHGFIDTTPLTLANPNEMSAGILPPHSYDFLNFMKHSMEFLRKNEGLASPNKLFVLKVRSLENNPDVNWTDAEVMETLNKSTLYRPVLENYRSKVTGFINNDSGLPYLEDFHSVSKDVVNTVLNLVYTIKGLDGIITIRTNLLNVITESSRFDPDCLKVYNLLIYSAPFVLIEAFLDPTTSLTQEMFFNAPFESIANSLYQHMLIYDCPDLNIIIRTQMRLENSLPETTTLRTMYDASIAMYRTLRLTCTVGSIITPVIGITGILLRTLTAQDVPMQIAQNTPIQTEPVTQDDEIVDVCVKALVWFILN